MKIILATQEQKYEYLKEKPLYPLHGFVEMKVEGSGETVSVPVEDLRGLWSKPDPLWEAVLPEGWHIAHEQMHSVLGFTQRDLLDRLEWMELEKCCRNIDCGCEVSEAA